MKGLFIDSPATIAIPPEIPEEKFRDWFLVPSTDPVIEHLTGILWNQEISPKNWQAACISPGTYIYRESETGWKIVAKFYSPKAGQDAIRHAEHEYQRIQLAREYLNNEHELRSVKSLGVWRGILFLEFIRGLTLKDKIAIRRSQPGELFHSLEHAGKLLSKLHTSSIQEKSSPDFGLAADYSYKLIDNLAKHGVLQNQPDVQYELIRLIEKWSTSRLMWDFLSTLNHGDATTTNIIFPPGGGAVAIDWERSEFADPAADLGRLMSEVAHSVNIYGGNYSEGISFANKLAASYCDEFNKNGNSERLIQRARFYQAASTLRIARNGWLSRNERLALALQAFALLSQEVNLPAKQVCK